MSLLHKAVADRALSLRAVGLLAEILVEGSVPTQDELTRRHAEGRDAVRRAWRELVDAGYLKCVRMKIKGQYVTRTTVAQDDGNPALSPQDAENPQPRAQDDWFPAFPYISTSTSTSSEVISDEEKNRTSSVLLEHAGRAPSQKRGSKVDYTIFDGDDSDGEGGAVGHLPEDKAHLRLVKYKREVVERPRWTDKRTDKPVDEWNSPELVAEFCERVAKATTKVAQVNQAALRGTFAKWRKGGTTSGQIVAGMDRFFADTRNLHEIGQKFPLWKRFISYYTTNQVDIGVAAGTEVTSMDEMYAQVAESGARLGKRRF